MESRLKLIFQTDSAEVHSLLNLDVGVNLASIGNKLYLIYCGDIGVAEVSGTLIETTTTTTPISIDKPVSLTYPNGNEFLTIGSSINITWISDRSVNDAVKIDLYKGEELSFVINNKTSNDGIYEWTPPSILTPSDDYKVKITWLSASESDINSDMSDNFFSIGYVAPTTTTTTTTLLDETKPNINNCRGIPIVELPMGEYITDMIKDISMGGVLFSTSKGRILTCRNVTLNAYLTGQRNVYAEVTDGFGNISDTAWTSFMYALYNRIIQVNEDKEVVNFKFEENATAILVERVTGEFLSSIMYVKEDIGFWKTLTWRETKPDNTEILIFLRDGDTADELQSKPWDICFKSEDSDTSDLITKDIMNSGLEGRYMQMKVVMTTDASNITPSVLDIGISYSTKFAVYFYTTKFALENNSDIKRGLLVANMTKPQGTEINFGICNTNSSDWNDYEPVQVDKLFDIGSWERIKVGIKMIPNGDEVPEVAEFALVTGAEINSLVNR